MSVQESRSPFSADAMERFAVRAVAKACRVTRQVQQDLAQVRAITKSDRSPVTVADFAAQAIINHELSRALGEAGQFHMIGEESAALLREPAQHAVRAAVVEAVQTVWPDASEEGVLDAIDLGRARESVENCWTLDPVDGTKGFLRNGQYALALAFIERGEVRFGAMGCPNLSFDPARSFDDPDERGLIAFARLGGGAYAVPADDPDAAPVRFAVGDAGHRIRVCESVEIGHTRHDDATRIVEHLGGGGAAARLDSQAKYAVVARGQADAYLRLPTKPGYVERIWDHAAGMMIAHEAGAVVTDIHGRPLDFSQGAGLERNRGILCAHPAWHGRIIEAIDALGLEFPG